MARRTPIDCAPAPLGVLRHVWGDPDATAAFDEVRGVLGLVRIDALAPLAGGGGPSLGTKLFCEAHARTSVPSTEKCSADSKSSARA